MPFSFRFCATVLYLHIVLTLAHGACTPDFSTESNYFAVETPQYFVRQSGPHIHLLSKTPSGYIVTNSYFQVEIEHLVEIFSNNTPVTDDFEYLLQSDCLGHKETKVIYDALDSSKMVTQTTVYYDFTFSNGAWVRTSISSFSDDVYITEASGPTYLLEMKSVKLGVQMANYSFSTSNDTKLRTRLNVGVITNETFDFDYGDVTTQEADPNYPNLLLGCNNVTSGYLRLTMCAEYWATLDGQINPNIQTITPSVLRIYNFTDTYFGAAWDVLWPQFQNAIWDPSFDLLFTGPDPGLGSTPVAPTAPGDAVTTGNGNLPPQILAAVVVPILVVVTVTAIALGALWYRRRQVMKLEQMQRIHDKLGQRNTQT